MLTATYTLVTLSVEQASVRMSLQSLRKLLQSNYARQTALAQPHVSYACDVVQRLYQNFQLRKTAMFLIPALRCGGTEADKLLVQLDALTGVADEARAGIVERASAARVDNEQAVRKFCDLIDLFCEVMLTRIEREERELFALARTIISGEAWFDIANQMLARDAYRHETRSVHGLVAPQREPLPAEVHRPEVRRPERRHAASIAG